MALNTSKTPAIAIIPGNDMLLFFNDYTPHDVTGMTLRDDAGGAAKFSGSAVSANYRMLMWARTHPQGVVGPVRHVPYVHSTGLIGSSISPLYEAINPSVQSVSAANVIALTFWTNFQAAVVSYEPSYVIKFLQTQLGAEGAIPSLAYRALCVTLIYLRRFHVTGGEIADSLGGPPTGTGGYELVPIATKPHIIQLFKEDYPITDFSGMGDGSGTATQRLHDHRDNYNGGFAFSVYHPGTGVPQLPWEV
jgi:hypothetical protein